MFLRASALSAALLLSTLLTPRTGLTMGTPCDGDWCVPCPPPTSPSGVLLITPAGNGPSLNEALLQISVEIVNCEGSGAEPEFPADAIGLTAFGSALNLCSMPEADQETNAQGQTTISGTIAGGGWWEPSGDFGGLRVTVAGIPSSPPLPIGVVSPDLNGDLRVDLVDVGIYSRDLKNGRYDFRSDLHHDGVEDLSDIAVFAGHIGETCP